MKKLMMLAALAAVAAGTTGCKSITVEKRPHAPVTYTDTNGVVQVLCDTSGKPVFVDNGWEVSYFQHWTWTKLDTLNATAGAGVTLSLNGYESGADSNLVALVSASFDGAALLAAKVGAAIASSGGSVAADALSAAIKRYISKGGSAAAATVTCTDSGCTISDGTVTETCTDCILK